MVEENRARHTRRLQLGRGYRFIPIVNIAATPNVIAAYPKLPFLDDKGMLAAVKREPGQYSYASFGNGRASPS